MMNNKHTIAIILGAVIAAGSALAAETGHKENDAAMLASAKITLQQAITTAEQQTGGKATGADLTRENGVVQIEVEIAGSQGEKTVLVNAQTGQVTATHAADQDND